MEIKRTQSIGLEQKKISQSLRDVKKELEGNRKKLDLFQTVVSNAQEEIEEGHVKLASISSEISQIQVKNSLIDEECIHLKNQYTIIHHQQEQIKMGYQKKKKIQEHRSARKSIFDHVKNRIRSVRIFTSAKTDQLKKYSVSIATSFGKNMSYAASKIDSVMVSIALNAIKYSVKIVLDFTVKVTISMVKNSHPTTLVIIGIFTSCFSCVAIITYPLTSIVLGGIIFVIMKDAAFSSFNNWKNATNPGHQEI